MAWPAGRTLRAARSFGLLLLVVGAVACGSAAASVDPAVTSVYRVAHPVGLMATSGGWAYCLQVRHLAHVKDYDLICGRYYRDAYTNYGLRARRHLDWGDPAYLASFATKIAALHRTVGGPLVLVGVSYSGFGVATLASHHPELRSARVIVIDSFLNLVARRAALPETHPTAREIDAAVRGSGASLQQRSVSISGLAALVRAGTILTVVWSVAPDERREFAGATCDLHANAATLAAVADATDEPVPGWVTQSGHGYDLWDHGQAILAGHPPGTQVTFNPGAAIPTAATCT